MCKSDMNVHILIGGLDCLREDRKEECKDLPPLAADVAASAGMSHSVGWADLMVLFSTSLHSPRLVY